MLSIETKAKHLAVILRRYILIFALALISCAGTNYIHALSHQDSKEQDVNQSEMRAVNEGIKEMKGVSGKIQSIELN